MKRLFAFLGLVTLAAAAPAALLSTYGPPYAPRIDLQEAARVLSGSSLAVDSVLRALALVAWLLWGYLAAAALLRIAALTVLRRSFRVSSSLVAFTDRTAPSLLVKLVDAAVGGALLLSTIVLPKPIAAHTAPPAATAPATFGDPVAASSNGQSEDEAKSYVVRPGDSLWKIGKRELGSGFRWAEIFDMNKERLFPDGKVLKDPRLIRPNWVLWLPGHSSPNPQASPVPGELQNTQKPSGPRALNENNGVAGPDHHVRVPAPVPAIAPDASPQPSATTEAKRAEGSPHPTSPSSSNGSDGEAKRQRPARRKHISKAPIVKLESGAAIAASFASGVLASQALAALRRRRRYRPLSAPEEEEAGPWEAEPAVVVQAKRAQVPTDLSFLKASAARLADAFETAGRMPPVVWAVENRESVTFLVDADAPDDLPEEGELELIKEGDFVRAVVPKADPAGSERRPAVEEGLLVPVGVDPSSGAANYCGLAAAGPVAALGSLAGDWTRQALLALAADHSPDDLQVFVLGNDLPLATTLPHVARAADWQGAPELIKQINRELLGRGRLLSRANAPDLQSYLTHEDREYFPALLVVVAEPPENLKAQVEGIAAQGSRFGCGFIAVGWRPRSAETALFLEAATEVDSTLPITETLEPFLLEDSVAEEILGVIVAAHHDEGPGVSAVFPTDAAVDDVASNFLEPHNGPTADNGVNGQQPWHPNALPQPNGKADPRPTTHVPSPKYQVHLEQSSQPSIEGQVNMGTEAVNEPGPEPQSTAPSEPKNEDLENSEVTVRCLGTMTVSRKDSGRPIVKGWYEKSKELIAYLVAHRDGAPKDRIIETLWPEISFNKSDYQLRQGVYYLRKQISGDDEEWSEKYIRREGEIVRLDWPSWDVDVWRFESLIHASTTMTSERSASALREALALYGGDFCDDTYFSWSEPVRQRLRRSFLKASGRLSALLEELGCAQEAVEVLERAIEVDPVNEEIYRQAIRMAAANGNFNSARLRYRNLTATLSKELGEEPEPATKDLMRSLESRSRLTPRV